MNYLDFPAATRRLGAPRDWNAERDGPCDALPIRDHVFPGQTIPVMLSYWEPTPDELAALNNGAKIRLGVCGPSHPPVSMDIVDEVGG